MFFTQNISSYVTLLLSLTFASEIVIHFNGNVMEILTFLVTLGGICLFFACGASAVETDSVSVFVMEEDAVMLYTNFLINQTDRMIWFSGDNRIAIINGYQSKICIDDWCKERFRDRLKLDHQTGSLTIMNITNTDSGLYKLEIISSRNTVNIFSVTVHDVSVAERDEIKRKSVNEGESVTLVSDETKKTNDEMRWYYNVNLITEFTGDQSKICTDDQCKERFRGRLKLDHQTGSLTITNTTITDSGLYQLQINSSRFSIIRSFSVTVTYASDSGSDSGSSSVSAVVVVVLLLLLIVAAVVFYQRKAIMGCIRRQRGDQMNVAEEPPLEQTNALMPITTNGISHNETEAANEYNIIYFTEREN